MAVDGSAAGDEVRASPRLWHSDDDLLVVEKPAGLLAVPGRGPEKSDCLSARVAAIWPGALVVHRLDMATSGLMIFARHAAAQRLLGTAFAERRVQKRYVAVVTGTPRPNDSSAQWQTIDLPIAADWPRRPLRIIDTRLGRPSLTRWRCDPAGPGGIASCAPFPASRLLLGPETGRTHQLRVHLQAIGHPILGDALYAPAEVAAAAPRLLLHASRLAFAHPATGQPLAFESPAPF